MDTKQEVCTPKDPHVAVTIGLIEPQIAIIFHGPADSGQVNNPAEAG